MNQKPINIPRIPSVLASLALLGGLLSFGFTDCGDIDTSKIEDGQATYRKIGDVSGAVLDDADSAPIVGAMVWMADKTESTDQAGAFYFKEIPAGNQTLIVHANGYQQLILQVEVAPGANAIQPIRLTAGEDDCVNDTPCDDGLFCTVEDVCVDGMCGGTQRDCDDGDPQTLDSCSEEAKGCTHIGYDCVDDAPCDDGLFCTVEDVCVDGLCMGAPLDCDDGDPETNDWCDEEAQTCAHAGVQPSCGWEHYQVSIDCSGYESPDYFIDEQTCEFIVPEIHNMVEGHLSCRGYLEENTFNLSCVDQDGKSACASTIPFEPGQDFTIECICTFEFRWSP